MAESLTTTGAQYGTGIGLIYVFNLIVGTGALTMPKAFQEAGWLLSLILLVFLAFASYMTVTFVTESMAVANAVLKQTDDKPSSKTLKTDELSPLIGKTQPGSALPPPKPTPEKPKPDPETMFDITERVEMGKMAQLFFNKVGEKLFYLCIIVYLYGDLAIYVVAVPKSLRDTVCSWQPENETLYCNTTQPDSDPCWYSSSLTRMDVYRIFVTAFILLLGPFVFFNVQKTKYLQIATSMARWLAFSIMIVLAVIRLAQGGGQGRPPIANFAGVPNLFGVCVYSFMCHHSLPSLITPIKNKSKLYKLLATDYLLILGFYALLSFTGIYTFQTIMDLYTLNFLDRCGNNPITNIAFFQYFLALFPVFTLSTNFPIISITLRNNLKTLILKSDKEYSPMVHHMFPILAMLPPAIVGILTNQVEFLVGITGSYAGAGIQYVIPAMLVFCARRDSVAKEYTNKHKSPFFNVIWVILTVGWATICILFVTVNHIVTKK